jgi:hypothetical protein
LTVCWKYIGEHARQATKKLMAIMINAIFVLMLFRVGNMIKMKRSMAIAASVKVEKHTETPCCG